MSGQMKDGERLSVRINARLKNKIKRQAKLERRSVAQLVKVVMEDYCKEANTIQ